MSSFDFRKGRLSAYCYHAARLSEESGKIGEINETENHD
jgi:hypothetical protein